MRLPKLTALLLSVSLFAACERSSDWQDQNTYVGTTTMSGAQETPAITSSATGTVEASYNRLSKTLSYKVTFSGLAANASAAHIHGTAPTGYAAGVLQTFSGFPAATSGTYSGSVLIDGVKFTESNLLSGLYYVNIHNATRPAGEIRAQILLNRL
jgi:hypothetical protein